MTLLDTATIAGLETVINAKRALDHIALQALQRLEGKTIRVRTPASDLMFTFEDSKPSIVSLPTHKEPAEETADATITGSGMSILEAVFREDPENIVISGDEELIKDFRLIFRPNVETSKVTEQIRAFSEYGIATIKSAFQGIGSSSSSADAKIAISEKLGQLEVEVHQLKLEIENLKSQLAAKEDD